MTSWRFASPIPERQPHERLSQLFDHLLNPAAANGRRSSTTCRCRQLYVCPRYWVLVNGHDRETSFTLKLQLLARGRQRHFFIKSTDTRRDNHPACRFSLTVVRLAHANQGNY
jgi:hypothetical protein